MRMIATVRVRQEAMNPAASGTGNERVLMLETASRPYHILVEKMQQGAVAAAADGTIRYCNRRFAEMLKRPVDEVIGASVYRFLAAPSQVAYAEVAGSGSGQGEFGLVRSDGTVTPVHVAVNAIQDSEAATYLIVTDLTEQLARRRAEQLAERLEHELEERKRAEDALRLSEARIAEASRRKDEFLAVLSHELRGPLAPIQNALHVLQRDPHGPLAQQAREIVERQTTLMARLTDDLLDLSRISNGTIPLRAVRLDLAELVRRAAEDYRITLETAELKLETRLPEKELWVNGDATRLSQILTNVLQNASKFTEAGGKVLITLSEDPDGSAAIIAVRDTGVGMDGEHLARIFDAFRLGTRGSARSGGGLGIGMALAKGLVELHGGRIAASSDGPGRGCEFSIRLPLERETAPAPKAIRSAPAPTKSYRVLVIEDCADAAESMEMLLELMGHDVEKVHDGPAAVEVAKRYRPEIVICDIGLPGPMDGYAVAEVLRRDFPRGSAFMIALTGYGQHKDQLRSHEAGFDFHLTKPADPRELEKLLASLSSQI
ncbi:MAG: response regulator [Candidatus Eisenbacteria bacterium]|uniref:histidine kinase n=1 Tax=Eiseniibacteriota bacterium TaxID=2212470 RepID=A0A538T5I1_UNCEI|nr:MAG: response regulator [Candidatus Eisenbacteria bacterium]